MYNIFLSPRKTSDLKDGRYGFSAISSPIFFHNCLHFIVSLLHFFRRLKLRSTSVQILGLPLSFEVFVSRQMVGEEPQANRHRNYASCECQMINFYIRQKLCSH
mmetsp:Transcript_9750/g.16151  ORF Transcript_9750/g.16151 Transcript_9750/m.16151 type:complete len:104 (+) Transcript_9750:17-328(+)